MRFHAIADVCELQANAFLILGDPCSMETMHSTPDTEALLDCESFRAALHRCLSAFKDRPLIGVIERRRGRGSTPVESNVETLPADAQGEGAWGGRLGSIFDSGPAASKAQGTGKDKRKSKVHFATYAKLHRRCQYIGYSLVNQLMLPEASSCAILCRSSQHAPEVVAWELACVLGGFVLVLTDWDAAPPHTDESGSEVDAGAEEIMQSARRLVREGVRAVLAEEAAVAPLIVAVAEIAAGLTRDQASRRRLVRDIVVVRQRTPSHAPPRHTRTRARTHTGEWGDGEAGREWRRRLCAWCQWRPGHAPRHILSIRSPISSQSVHCADRGGQPAVGVARAPDRQPAGSLRG